MCIEKKSGQVGSIYQNELNDQPHYIELTTCTEAHENIPPLGKIS